MAFDRKLAKGTGSVDTFFQKIKHYCSYQERCHYEVREKLYSFGLHKGDVENLLTQLIVEGFLDEERFAESFARGKLSLKKWGRVKIKHALKERRVSEYNIKTAIKKLDDAVYIHTLEKLVAEKWEALKSEQYLNRQAKTIAYLLQKGFELPLVQTAIKKLREES